MINRYPMKKYFMVGVCGLDCGLCPRYHTDGKVKCHGCCGLDFYDRHHTCSMVNCCVRQRGMETCALCSDLEECQKIYQVKEAAQDRDTFISYKPISANIEFIRKNGLSDFATQQYEKQKLLLHLLEKYDDGRSKLFYCTACQLLPQTDLAFALNGVDNKISIDTDIKERSKMMRSTINKLAEQLDVDLKLRNKIV